MGCNSSKEKNQNKNKGKNDSKQKLADTKATSSSSLVDPDNAYKGKVEDFYTIHKEIGRGTFSIVKEATNKATGEKYALKFIDKKFVDSEDLVLLRREIDIMKKVSHKNVLSLKEIYETKDNITLVMELVSGGELFFKIVERGSYSEKDASALVRQILEGVKYLHDLGICHRDLKPENLLVATQNDVETIKIADFGLSKVFAGGQQLETSCGTPDYAAPEVLLGEKAYDNSVDLWSVGVITYVLLCGYPPFYATSQPALFEKIIKANYNFPNPEWSVISDSAKDFIKNLLLLDPKKRLTAEECLEHPFLKGAAGNNSIQIETMSKYNVERKKQLQRERAASDSL